jgi:hypothetical protein
MKILKTILDFYIHSSIHVALSVFALVQMTDLVFGITSNGSVAYFAFFGTVVGYNFVKYDALVRSKKIQMRNSLKLILLFSVFSFIAVGFFFFQLQRITQMVSVAVLVITLLYTLPFFPNRKNARNWAGVKIYIVALCWVGVTVVLPIIDAEIAITSDFYIKSVQRFILVFVLILIFEIIDLKKDDPYLKTMPQQIGVGRTKYLGYILLLLFCGLEFLDYKVNDDFKTSFFSFPLQFIVAAIVALFLYFVNENRSKYYTSFWVESIPILWWLMVVLL